MDIGKKTLMKAKSKQTDYSNPVVIAENSNKKIEILPHYINRSSGLREISLKFNYYDMDKFSGWEHNKNKSFGLKDEEVSNLQKELSQFMLFKGQKVTSEYYLIPVSKEYDLDGEDPDKVLDALFNAISSNRGLLEKLKMHDLPSQISSALKSRVRFSELQNAISNLESLIDDSGTSEKQLQAWCDEHFWVFGNAYVARDEVRSISTGDQLDLLLQRTANGLRDIVELKLAKEDVLFWDSTHKNFYFSSHVSKAIGQCQRYLDVFSELGRNGLMDNKHIISYYPNAIIVIGRSHEWEVGKHKALHGLNQSLHGIKVKTYDEVLAEAKAALEILAPNDSHSQIDDLADTANFDLDDEIPF